MKIVRWENALNQIIISIAINVLITLISLLKMKINKLKMVNV